LRTGIHRQAILLHLCCTSRPSRCVHCVGSCCHLKSRIILQAA
jgi:hypothetical protein